MKRGDSYRCTGYYPELYLQRQQQQSRAEQKLSCNGTVPEAITVDSDDEHGLACETLAHPTPVITTHRSHMPWKYNGFPRGSASCSGRLGLAGWPAGWLADMSDRLGVEDAEDFLCLCSIGS